MRTGRPTDYSPEILERTKLYLEEYHKEPDTLIPSIAGLAVVLERARGLIYEWGKKNPEFQDILDKIQAKQEQLLVNNGLGGKFNSAITKLVLGKHGYHERQELTGKDGGPVEGKWVVETVKAKEVDNG